MQIGIEDDVRRGGEIIAKRYQSTGVDICQFGKVGRVSRGLIGLDTQC